MQVGWIVMGEPPQPDPPYVDQWGLMREDEDLDQEYERIREDVQRLETEGYEMIGGDVTRGPDDVWDLSGKFSDVDVLIVYGVSGAGRGSRKALMSYGVPLVMVVQVREHELYGHALFQQWYSRDALKDFSDVHLVINDHERLVDILEAYRAAGILRASHILCVGEPNDYFDGRLAARRSHKRFGPDIEFMSFGRFHDELEKIDLEDSAVDEARRAFVDGAASVDEDARDVARGRKSARVYLTLKRLIREHDYDAVTINCLSGILNLVDTTPCLAFMRLRDEGLPAVCEADIPQTMTSILMRTLANRPTFINDPVILPEKNRMILAHCTAPTKMSGYEEPAEEYEAKLHHETKLGLAPGVQFAKGKQVTVAGFSHEMKTIIATPGRIVRNTDYHICISQCEVAVPDSEYLFEEFQGFHWVMVYGNWMNRLKETANILDVEFLAPESDEIPDDLEPLPDGEEGDRTIPAHMGVEPLHQGPEGGPFTPHDVPHGHE